MRYFARPFLRAAAFAIGLLTMQGLSLAQVPVTDAKGLTKQVNISDCFQKIQKSNNDRVTPSQNITKSHTTTGSAGSAGQVGSSNVAGTQTASTSAPSAALSSSDLSAYSGSAGNLGSLNTGTYNQGLNANNAAAGALPANTIAMQGIQGQVGTLDAEQQAFDQNTASRVSTAALWNQAIQTGLMWAQLRNQSLANQVAGAAAVSNAMNFTTVPLMRRPATTDGCNQTRVRFGNGATLILNNCP